jgi:hypothetical protein
MSTIIRDRLEVGGASHAIDVCPLDAWLAMQPERPAARHALARRWGACTRTGTDRAWPTGSTGSSTGGAASGAIPAIRHGLSSNTKSSP